MKKLCFGSRHLFRILKVPEVKYLSISLIPMLPDLLSSSSVCLFSSVSDFTKWLSKSYSKDDFNLIDAKCCSNSARQAASREKIIRWRFGSGPLFWMSLSKTFVLANPYKYFANVTSASELVGSFHIFLHLLVVRLNLVPWSHLLERACNYIDNSCSHRILDNLSVMQEVPHWILLNSWEKENRRKRIKH